NLSYYLFLDAFTAAPIQSRCPVERAVTPAESFRRSHGQGVCKLMQPRTQREREILEYITRFIERHGYEPSYAQIARHFGVSSKATIAKHIEALERRGLISRHRKHGAFGLAIRIAEAPADAVCEVALLGRIAAGAPIDAIEDMEMICVPRFL